MRDFDKVDDEFMTVVNELHHKPSDKSDSCSMSDYVIQSLGLGSDGIMKINLHRLDQDKKIKEIMIKAQFKQ